MPPAFLEGRAAGDSAASLFGRDVLLAILPPEQRLASLAGRDVPLAILPQPLRGLLPYWHPPLIGRASSMDSYADSYVACILS